MKLPKHKPEWMKQHDWDALEARDSGMTYGQVGEFLGIKQATAFNRIKRAEASLKEGHYVSFAEAGKSPKQKKELQKEPEAKPEKAIEPKHKIDYLTDGTLYWFYLDGKVVESGRVDSHHDHRLTLLNGIAKALGTTVTKRDIPSHDDLLKAYVNRVMSNDKEV